MAYDEKIQRHQVVRAAEQNGWQRAACPDYDLFTRGGTEVYVLYFKTNVGRIQYANIGNVGEASRVPAGPRNRLDTLLGWLQAPGE